MSAFQKRIRSGAQVLYDHLTKEMNPLNLERCRCIPKNMPGADWRVLQEIVADDPSREKFQVTVAWLVVKQDSGSSKLQAFVSLLFRR